MNPREQAEHFVANETQFQLGFLPTEQSHNGTRVLGSTAAESPLTAVLMLLNVDRDIADLAGEWLSSVEYERLVEAVQHVIRSDRRIVFSGCGATGRLAVLLEAMWRRYWNATGEPAAATRSRGIITGGDRALIRSVENFEDYQEFGREQVRELSLREGDLFIAISEGGETSSVIGSAHQALDDGCTVFFVFNNPADLLCERIERSRALIQDERVTVLDLTTGSMALSGSTRMQATTAELLVVGAALEDAIARERDLPWTGSADSSRFTALLNGISDDAEAIASLVEREADVYQRGGMVLYRANEFLLDIFGDTTERTPTFSIPPFQRRGEEPQSHNPWAVAYNATGSSEETWRAMLGRDPIGLDWDESTYRRLGAPGFLSDLPVLTAAEIAQYPVGEEVARRYESLVGLSLEVGLDDEGTAFCLRDSEGTEWRIRVNAPAGPLSLWAHIAVKLIFNTLSTATMAVLGRVRGNWMTQVSPTNKKLIDRSIRIVADLRAIPYEEAAFLVFQKLADRGQDRASIVNDILA